MNIIQCSFCKKPFQTLGGKICPACLERIDKDFITVRDYIYDNKSADIDTVSEDTEVPKQIIMHLLKEGRLIIGGPEGEGGGVLFCEICKKPINTGRMCDSCKEKVATKMQKSVSGSSPAPPRKNDEPSIKGSAKLNR
jgi:predicted amidophosphoribosyltransferase